MDNLLLTKCELKFSAESFCIHAPDEAIARQLKTSFRWLAVQAQKLGKAETRVYFPGCRKPYQIPVSMAAPGDGESELDARSLSPNSPSPDLLGADYMRILEFLLDERKQGKIVIITDHLTGICLHTNDLLSPARGLRSPGEWEGYNYMRSWRRDRGTSLDPKYLELNPDFDQMCRNLERDGYVNGYNYSLYRPHPTLGPEHDDLCQYSTDFHLCHNYRGRTVRIGVSRPQDWALLEPAIA